LPEGDIAEIHLKGKHNIPANLTRELERTAGFIKMQES